MSGNDDTDVLVTKLARSAQAVSRLSQATKVVCAVMLVVAGVMMIYALSRAGSRDEELVVFGLLSLLTTALALVFWSNAAFHAAFARSTEVLSALHVNADLLVRLQQQSARPGRAKPAPTPVATMAASAPAAPASESAGGPAERPGSEAEAASFAAAAPSNRASDGASSPTDATTRVETGATAFAASPSEKTCRTCKGTIRADALRCKWCFERV